MSKLQKQIHSHLNLYKEKGDYIPSINSKQQDLALKSLKFTVVADQSEFFDLKDSWNTLLNNTSESVPFLSWEWQYTWWETFANEDDQLLILCIYQDNDLIGLAPLYIKNKILGKVLKIIGEGEARDEAVITHYQDIICEKRHSNLIAVAIAEYLDKIKTWDFSEFSFILDNATLLTMLEASQSTCKLEYSLGHRYVIDLRRSFEDLYSSLGKSSRKSFRSKRNRLQNMGELSLESLDVDENYDESLEIHAFFQTHRQQALGRKGNFLEPRFKQFHLSLIGRLIKTGRAQIRVLKLNDKPIACTLNYISKEAKTPTVYSYSSGYKSEDDARLSPMFIFDMLEFEHLIGDKVAFYDFLSSTDAVSYKDAYRCDMQAVSRCYRFEITPIGIFYYVSLKTKRLLSTAKKWVKNVL